MLKEIVNIISNNPPPPPFTIYNLQFTVYNLQFTVYSLQLTPLIGDVRAVLNGCGADKEII